MRAPPSCLIRFDQVQRLVVGGDLNAVWALDLRGREDARQRARCVNPVNGGAAISVK